MDGGGVPTIPPIADPSLPNALPRRLGPGAGPAARGEGSQRLQLSVIPTHPALTVGHYLRPPRPLLSNPSLPVALSPRLSITLQHGLFHYFNRAGERRRCGEELGGGTPGRPERGECGDGGPQIQLRSPESENGAPPAQFLLYAVLALHPGGASRGWGQRLKSRRFTPPPTSCSFSPRLVLPTSAATLEHASLPTSARALHFGRFAFSMPTSDASAAEAACPRGA